MRDRRSAFGQPHARSARPGMACVRADQATRIERREGRAGAPRWPSRSGGAENSNCAGFSETGPAAVCRRFTDENGHVPAPLWLMSVVPTLFRDFIESIYSLSMDMLKQAAERTQRNARHIWGSCLVGASRSAFRARWAIGGELGLEPGRLGRSSDSASSKC